MYNHPKAHLIPQLLIDRAGLLIREDVQSETKEIYAQQLEVVKEFCEKTLDQYNKSKFKNR